MSESRSAASRAFDFLTHTVLGIRLLFFLLAALLGTVAHVQNRDSWALREAARSPESLSTLRSYLKADARANAPDTLGRTAGHHAALHVTPQSWGVLAGHENPNATNDVGNTPEHSAGSSETWTKPSSVAAHRASFSMASQARTRPTNEGDTPLHVAAKSAADPTATGPRSPLGRRKADPNIGARDKDILLHAAVARSGIRTDDHELGMAIVDGGLPTRLEGGRVGVARRQQCYCGYNAPRPQRVRMVAT